MEVGAYTSTVIAHVKRHAVYAVAWRVFCLLTQRLWRTLPPTELMCCSRTSAYTGMKQPMPAACRKMPALQFVGPISTSTSVDARRSPRCETFDLVPLQRRSGLPPRGKVCNKHLRLQGVLF